MKTIQEYLNGQHDEELRALVAEARGWTDIRQGSSDMIGDSDERQAWQIPPYPTSRDACKELLADLDDEQLLDFQRSLLEDVWQCFSFNRFTCGEVFLRATARQICVACLIVKGFLK